MMEHWTDGSWGGGMSTTGAVLMMLVWVALLALIVFAVVRLVGSRDGAATHASPAAPTTAASPRQIADERLARGEIDVAAHAEIVDRLERDR